MSDAAPPSASATSGAGARVESLTPTLVRVAWAAVLLGLVMEAIVLLVSAGTGVLRGFGPAVADTIRQVSWSGLVCFALALGTAASKLRVPLMGLLGLIAGPVAFAVARSLHQATAEALDVAPAAAGATGTLVAVAALKGVEYGLLGALIGYVGRQAWGDLKAHLGVGLALGLIFGGGIVAVTASAAATAPTAASLLPQIVNEVAFPVGCSLVLYVAAAVARYTAD